MHPNTSNMWLEFIRIMDLQRKMKGQWVALMEEQQRSFEDGFKTSYIWTKFVKEFAPSYQAHAIWQSENPVGQFKSEIYLTNQENITNG